MASSIRTERSTWNCGSRVIPKEKAARIANVSAARGSSNVGQPR